ncbi:MAG: hypothetical protein QG567_530 [Campylobacterota bacterium]|nr:hypothetical protein [Campylobacterota bacterium]
MQNSPLVSVVMSVYNGGDCVGSAIESILRQSYKNFEFIVVNDGSNDESLEILKEYAKKDSRIIIINQENIGLTKSLNKAIKSAKGKYIARQDADDISLQDRLQKQVEFLETNEGVVLLGTNQYEVFGDKEAIGRYYDDKEINKIVYIYNPFAHTSAMFRGDVFIKIGMYDENYKTSQDFEAWMRMAKEGKIAMLKEPLVKRVINPNSITKKRKKEQYLTAFKIRLRHAEVGYFAAIMASIYQAIMAHMPKWIIDLKRG